MSEDLPDVQTSASEGLSELKAIQAAFEALEPLGQEGRMRALSWILSALGLSQQQLQGAQGRGGRTGTTAAVENGDGSTPTPTPKEFLTQKKPANNAERFACLAYYLTHMRNVRMFKSADLTALNIEAAGPKITNASRDFDNADRGSGYLVGAEGGRKQITARGEAVVEALPDRDAIKAALAEHPHRRRKASSSKRSAASASETE